MSTEVERTVDTEIEERIKKRNEGIALIISFLVLGMILYININPEFVGYKIIGLILSIIFFSIALLGFSVELSNVMDKKTSDFTFEILIGAIFIIGPIALHYYFPIWWINIISMLVLFLGVYAFSLGIIKLVSYFSAQNREGRNVSKIIFLILTQILTILSALAAVFEALGIKVDVFKDFFK